MSLITLIKSIGLKAMPPKLLIAAITKNLRKDVGHAVDKFDLVYVKSQDRIFWVIEGREIPFAQSKDFIRLVEYFASDKLQGKNIDIIKLSHNRNNKPETTLLFCYQDEKGKHTENIQL